MKKLNHLLLAATIALSGVSSTVSAMDELEASMKAVKVEKSALKMSIEDARKSVAELRKDLENVDDKFLVWVLEDMESILRVGALVGAAYSIAHFGQMPFTKGDKLTGLLQPALGGLGVLVAAGVGAVGVDALGDMIVADLKEELKLEEERLKKLEAELAEER